MPFLLLLLLTLACLPDNWQSLTWGGLSPARSAFLTWAGVALLVAVSAYLAHRTCRQLRRHPDQGESILHRYRSWRLYHWLGLIVFYGVALFVLGWGWAVQSLGPVEDGVPQMMPGAELLILAPFLASLILSWAWYYNVDRAMHEIGPSTEAGRPHWGRWAYVSFHLRQSMVLVVVPVALLMLQKGLRRLFPEYQDDLGFQLLMLGLLPLVFIGLPWVLRLVLGLKPMPEGPLRERLLTASRRLKFRCSNVLLWDTHGGVANAMVAGLVPSIRYVVLTDRLLTDLTPDEVEAVFGHEMGHVKHRHMLYYVGFLLISLAVVAGLWDLFAPLVSAYVPWLEGWSANQDLAALPFVALIGMYIFVVFGFLSRRCERQADIFGCRAVSCGRTDCCGHDKDVVLLPGGTGLCPTGIRVFIEALEKVARVNGINRSRPGWLQSWQHSTIARRVDFLQRVLVEPTLEARFQRTVGLVKLVLLLGLCGLLLVLYGPSGTWDRLLSF